MKRLTIAVLSITIFISFSFGQVQEATTLEGKKVILNSDGTWKYIEDELDSLSNNQELLLGGCWFYPHDAPTNIAFYKDFTFKFNSFDGVKKGTYSLYNDDVYLNCRDGSKYQFLIFEKQYLKSYPLEKKEYYLVHSKDWVHPNLE